MHRRFGLGAVIKRPVKEGTGAQPFKDAPCKVACLQISTIPRAISNRRHCIGEVAMHHGYKFPKACIKAESGVDICSPLDAIGNVLALRDSRTSMVGARKGGLPAH